MLDLAGSGPRHLRIVDDGYGARALVAGQVRAAPREQLGFRRRRAIAEHDDAMHPLAPSRVRQADHRGVLHCRVRGEDRTRFLQGMLSNDVASLATGRGTHALLLTEQGRVVGELRVVALAGVVLAVILAPPAYAALAMRLPDAARVAPMPPPTVPGWHADPAGQEADWRPQVVGTDFATQVRYRSDAGGRAVDLYVAYFAFQRQGAEAVHHGHRLAEGPGWLRTGGGRVALTGRLHGPDVGEIVALLGVEESLRRLRAAAALARATQG